VGGGGDTRDADGMVGPAEGAHPPSLSPLARRHRPPPPPPPPGFSRSLSNYILLCLARPESIRCRITQLVTRLPAHEQRTDRLFFLGCPWSWGCGDTHDHHRRILFPPPRRSGLHSEPGAHDAPRGLLVVCGVGGKQCAGEGALGPQPRTRSRLRAPSLTVLAHPAWEKVRGGVRPSSGPAPHCVLCPMPGVRWGWVSR
jgi:hypothetical protein